MAIVSPKRNVRGAAAAAPVEGRQNFSVFLEGVTVNTAAFCDAYHASRFENRRLQRSEVSVMLKDNLDDAKLVGLFHDFLAQYVDAEQVLTMKKKDSRFNYLEDLYEDVWTLDTGSLGDLFSRVRENSNIESACFKNLGYRITMYSEPHEVLFKCQNGGHGVFDIELKVSSEKPVFPLCVITVRDRRQCVIDKRDRENVRKFGRPGL